MSFHLFRSMKGFAWVILLAGVSAQAAQFTPLTPLPSPQIDASAPAYPGGNFNAGRLIDGDVKTEYATNGKGTDTFVEFRFPEEVPVAAFRHVDRNDPATIAASKLVFMDDRGTVLTSVAVTHAGLPAAQTVFMLPSPVAAQRVKWQVTQLGFQNYGTVGGAELAFFTAGAPEATPVRDTITVNQFPILSTSAAGPVQTLHLTITHPYAEPADAVLHLDGAEPHPLRLEFGTQELALMVPAVAAETVAALGLEVAGGR
ncbi:MAG TPA: hypothetical protein PLC40_10090, partial [Candidatus Hydrogenedentes bacterium]|nr:hypothetical protein [Candidatus Hydrogenedentota bacterium]